MPPQTIAPPAPRRPHRVAARLALAAVAGLVALAAWLPPAGAHTAAVGTAPANGAVLDEPPARVAVRFGQPLGAASEASVTVAGRRVEAAATLDAADRRRLVIALPADAGAGRYAVSWAAVAADGHPLAGQLAFTVRDAAAARVRAGCRFAPRVG